MARRPRSIEQTFDLVRHDIFGDDFRAWHAEVARSILANTLADMGTKPRVETFVDGNRGASEDTVKLYGVIRYEFSRAAQAVVEVLDWLRAEGAKVSPKYADAFAVGVLRTETVRLRGGREVRMPVGEGRLIPARNFAAQSRGIPADAGFIIVNTKSWSRKVDVQLIGLRPMVFTIPPFIFERAAVWLRARHPELAVNRWYTSTFSGQYRRLRGPKRGSRVQSPALLVARADA